MSPPPIKVRNVQRAVPMQQNALQRFAEMAGELTWQERCRDSDIEAADAVLVVIVSDSEMARLHKQFCGVSGPTDVLTFQHGEIVISAETAAGQARAFHTSVERELRLYILHGLLHLCGYDDRTPKDRVRMLRLQRKLFQVARQRESAREFERTSARVNLCDESAAWPGRSNKRGNRRRQSAGRNSGNKRKDGGAD